MLKAEQNHYFLAGIGEDARIFLSEADCPIDSPVQGFEFLDDAQAYLIREAGYSAGICRPIRHDLLQVLQVLQVPRPYQDRNLQNEPVVLP